MDLVSGSSLIIESPQAGREPATMMARNGTGAIQPDSGVRKPLRAGSADSLTRAAHVDAVESAAIAVANEYRRA